MNIRPIKKLLVANRSEIAIRVFRAAHELGIRTVAIYSYEDRFALHRFKAEEAYQIGKKGSEPVKAYLDIDSIIEIAKANQIDAIHPGYGFLSENGDFARACQKAGILFVGPSPELLDMLGNKTSARTIAKKANAPILSGSDEPVKTIVEAREIATKLGYPIILKAAHGGGGRGMRVVKTDSELEGKLSEAKRESLTAFGKEDVFIEKYVEQARHIEVQILGDQHKNLVHLFERDCSLQRRHQKVVEVAPAQNLPKELRLAICNSAVSICKSVNYYNAGTVEYLLDTATNKFYFIEINPRIQVEHTVTEAITGFDLVKRQILIAQGYELGSEKIGIPNQEAIQIMGQAFQCRLTTEDPENSFIPDYGKITHYRSASGMGIRLDAGTAFSGAVVTPYYDSLLVKVTATGRTFDDTIARMDRCLHEFRVRGVKTNLLFLLNLINHPNFVAGKCTTRFIDENPELFHFPKRRDRATRLLTFLGDLAVNGQPLVQEKPKTIPRQEAPIPAYQKASRPPLGFRDQLLKLGPANFCKTILEKKELLITDTTFRDAHQSIHATRMRTYDMVNVIEAYAYNHPDLFSLEMWGGATFDASMRFLQECPWDRLKKLRSKAPNMLFQMLLRASNGVGYTNYPDNVVREFTKQAAESGIDLFRVFDSLNWAKNMKVAMEAVVEANAICEAAICYTGDIMNPKRSKYNLKYYVEMAKELERMGAHIISIKDMAGLLKPYAAYELVSALKDSLQTPVHLHTHDTSGGQIATLIKAADAGVDIVDVAMAPYSGLTSQANLNSLVEMMRFNTRDTHLAMDPLAHTANYWEVVREYYAPFESTQKSSTAEVYRHEMPGGQYTNLYQQAHSMGLASRWSEICQMYADVNQLFGDIVKVTPSSKVVGDLALYLVTNDIKVEDVLSPDKDISFPSSVVDMFKGGLGQPPGGWPEALQKKVLRGSTPMTDRPGALMPSTDLESKREEVQNKINRPVSNEELMSYLMYPDVFTTYARSRTQNGDVSVIPTPIFFYGLPLDEEISLEIEPGKTLIVKLVAISEPNEEGLCKVFFELNGQPREVDIPNKKISVSHKSRQQANENNPNQIGAPMPGMVVKITAKEGKPIQKNDPILTMEAMKMETTIYADRSGVIGKIHVKIGEKVKSKDLLFEYE